VRKRHRWNRRATIALLCSAIAVLVPGGSVHAAQASPDDAVELVQLDTSSYPDVAAIVSVPSALSGRTLPASAFDVREGDRDLTLSAEPLGFEGLDVMLVVDPGADDTSLRAVQGAALELIRLATPGASMTLIASGPVPRVLVTRSDNATSTSQVVGQLRPGRGGDTLDALSLGLDQADVGAGSGTVVIVLAAELSGTVEQAQVLADRAEAAQVPVEVVLPGSSEVPVTAAAFATLRPASVTAAPSTGEVVAAIDHLVTRLAGRHRLRFRVTAGPTEPRTPIRIDVEFDGVDAGLQLPIAALRRPTVPAPTVGTRARAPEGTSGEELPPEGTSGEELPPEGTSGEELPPEGTSGEELPWRILVAGVVLLGLVAVAIRRGRPESSPIPIGDREPLSKLVQAARPAWSLTRADEVAARPVAGQGGAAVALPRPDIGVPTVPNRSGQLSARRLPLLVVVVGVALLPVLNPKGPSNSAPIDVVMVLGILAVILWAGIGRVRLHVPYVVPVLGLVLVGLASAFVSAAPRAGGTAVLQEVFLLAWCAAITSLCRTAGALQTVVRAWCLSAAGWASFLVVAVLSGQRSLAGIHGSDGGRARLLFDHPNMAGNYFMLSFFVVMAARYPRRPVARTGVYAVLLLGMVLAGSNTALLSVPVAGLVVIFLKLRSRTDLVTAAAIVLCLVLAGGAAWTFAARPVMSAIEETDNPLVRYSVARGSRSANARQSLFASQYELFQQGGLLGLGPAGTKEALDEAQASTAKESHNDYLATLVERGPLGVMALILLIATVAVRASGIGINRLTPRYAAVIPNPGALAGVCVAFAFTATTHEILHYRHLWTLFAIIAALHLFGRRSVDRRTAGPAPVGTARPEQPLPTAVR